MSACNEALSDKSMSFSVVSEIGCRLVGKEIMGSAALVSIKSWSGKALTSGSKVSLLVSAGWSAVSLLGLCLAGLPVDGEWHSAASGSALPALSAVRRRCCWAVARAPPTECEEQAPPPFWCSPVEKRLIILSGFEVSQRLLGISVGAPCL